MEQLQTRTERKLTGVILAAGESSRMGCAKLALPFQGDTILGRTIENAKKGGIKPLLVVSGAYRAEVEDIARQKGLKCLYNPAYATGQSSSLRRVLEVQPPDRGVMFILGDQPLVPPEVYRKLRHAYGKGEAWLVAPVGPDGRRGNPVIVAPPLFEDLARLRGDEGARSLFLHYAEMALLLPLRQPEIHRDIDTVEEYRQLCRDGEGIP